jgi:hypothetical protein
VSGLLAALDEAIGRQRQALARDDPDALEAASQALGAATSALAQARPQLDAGQAEHARRLQISLQANRELLNRTAAAKQRALEAIVGPGTTYTPAAGTSRAGSVSRLRTA